MEIFAIGSSSRGCRRKEIREVYAQVCVNKKKEKKGLRRAQLVDCTIRCINWNKDVDSCHLRGVSVV